MKSKSKTKAKQREITIKKETQIDIYKGLCIIENNICIKEGFGFYFSNFDEKTETCNAKYFGSWEKDQKEGLGAVLINSSGFIVGTFKENQLSGFGINYYFTNGIPDSLEQINEFFCGNFQEGIPYQGIFYCNQQTDDLILNNNNTNTLLLAKFPSYLKKLNHYIYFGKVDSEGKKNDSNGFVYDFEGSCMVCGHFERDMLNSCYQIKVEKDNNYDISDVIYIEFYHGTEKIKELWYQKAIEEKNPERLEIIKEQTRKLIDKYISKNTLDNFLKNKSREKFFQIIKEENEYKGNIEMNLDNFFEEMEEELNMDFLDAQ